MLIRSYFDPSMMLRAGKLRTNGLFAQVNILKPGGNDIVVGACVFDGDTAEAGCFYEVNYLSFTEPLFQRRALTRRYFLPVKYGQAALGV